MFSIKQWENRKEWSNWAGNVRAKLNHFHLPRSVDELAAIIRTTKDEGKSIRVTGAAHSFSPVALPDAICISLHHVRGMISIDAEQGEATFWAGTYLHEIGPLLADYGWALENMGDIQDQSLAGAISTGTHGTGLSLGSISNQVVSWSWLDGNGEMHVHRRGEDELTKALHISLGLLGVIVQVTIQAVPLYSLQYDSRQALLQNGLLEWQNDIQSNRHVEWFYFPGCEKIQVKVMNAIPIVTQTNVSKLIDKVKLQVIENGVFYLLSEVCRIQPTRTKLVSKISAASVPTGRKAGLSYEIFPSPRKVKFKETEYAIAIEDFEACMEEIHFMLKAHPFRVHFPIECRCARGEEGYLSPTQGRDSAFLAFHMYKGMDESSYFRWVYELMKKYNGRPHWGKMNDLTNENAKQLYPDFEKFQEIREFYDPDQLFLSNYLKTIFL